MKMWSRHPEMAAAWLLVMLLLVAVGVAPWESIRAHHPVGVVDVTQQRFELNLPAADDDGSHHPESRFTSFGPEGL